MEGCISMSKMNSQLFEDIKKLEQLEHRKQLQDNRARKLKEKNDERRKSIIGQIFLDFFPEFLELHPQKTRMENEYELPH